MSFNIKSNSDAVKGIELSCEQAFLISCMLSSGFPDDSVVKNLPAKQETQETQVQSLGLGRSPEGGNGNPLQYSCLKNPTERGAWWATVHGSQESEHN